MHEGSAPAGLVSVLHGTALLPVLRQLPPQLPAQEVQRCVAHLLEGILQLHVPSSHGHCMQCALHCMASVSRCILLVCPRPMQAHQAPSAITGPHLSYMKLCTLHLMSFTCISTVAWLAIKPASRMLSSMTMPAGSRDRTQ